MGISGPNMKTGWTARLLVVLLGACLPCAAQSAPRSIPINRKLDVLKTPRGSDRYRKLFRQAGKKLGGWKIHLARVPITGATLINIAGRQPDEPFLRVVRESLKRPVDLGDFVLFIDDVLRAGRRGHWGMRVWVGSGRARKAGILVHPDEVFRRRPRRYASGSRRLDIYKLTRTRSMRPAKDDAPPGPRWILRYPNPSGRRGKMRALEEVNHGGFARRVQSLMHQLEEQGADVSLWSTVRDRRRGYLIWGAFLLGRKTAKKQVLRTARWLQRLNRKWEMDVPIRWLHPGGWKATVRAARRMSDAYDVVYATMSGARYSNHYDGKAVDLTAVGLPHELTLEAPDGATRTFDLSHPRQTRDLSLTPKLLNWIEAHFQMEKLRSDYPHWNDTKVPLAPIETTTQIARK